MAVPLTDAEFASILGDEEKRIRNDITWAEDEDHSPAWEFRPRSSRIKAGLFS